MEEGTWLVTGAAGFVGSHLVESLLKKNQRVLGLDNLSTGKWQNLESVLAQFSEEVQNRFSFICEDITQLEVTKKAMRGVRVVLHQAALASVPLSIEDPLRFHAANLTGFLNILEAARSEGVKRVVYASSSAVYGDDSSPIKTEECLGSPLSPYALTKLADEIYADQYHRHYQLETIGLRYFNIYGRRQDPNGSYAAVIPKWLKALSEGEPLTINGDGTTTRDFCHISDVVEANLLAANTTHSESFGHAYNVCSGRETNLKQLAETLCFLWQEKFPQQKVPSIQYGKFRPGDIYKSCGSTLLAESRLGFKTSMSLVEGLRDLVKNY